MGKVFDLQSLVDKNPPTEEIKIRGFFRLNIVDPNGKIRGDSGWIQNQVTNEGRRNVARLIGGITGSSAWSHAALGSGGVPASNATTLAGEVESRTAVTAATNGSTSVQFTATFSSAGSFVTNTQNLSNIGLFPAASGNTLMAGNTFASSSCATNQNVNITYTITT